MQVLPDQHLCLRQARVHQVDGQTHGGHAARVGTQAAAGRFERAAGVTRSQTQPADGCPGHAGRAQVSRGGGQSLLTDRGSQLAVAGARIQGGHDGQQAGSVGFWCEFDHRLECIATVTDPVHGQQDLQDVTARFERPGVNLAPTAGHLQGGIARACPQGQVSGALEQPFILGFARRIEQQRDGRAGVAVGRAHLAEHDLIKNLGGRGRLAPRLCRGVAGRCLCLCRRPGQAQAQQGCHQHCFHWLMIMEGHDSRARAPVACLNFPRLKSPD